MEEVVKIDRMVIIWLCATVIFVIIEAMTVQMVCIWFALSSIVSLVLAMFGVPDYIQIIAFALCTAILLIFTRSVVRRLMKKPRTYTNADRVIGMPAVVIREINNDIPDGQVKVLNQIWTARSLNGDILPANTKVVIRSIEGVKTIVEKAE